MTHTWNRIKGRRSQYERLPLSEKEPSSPSKFHSSALRSRNRSRKLAIFVTLVFVGGLVGVYHVATRYILSPRCDHFLVHLNNSISQTRRCGQQVMRFCRSWLSLQPQNNTFLGPVCTLVFSALGSRREASAGLLRHLCLGALSPWRPRPNPRKDARIRAFDRRDTKYQHPVQG